MTTSHNHLSNADTRTIAAIESWVPTLVEARGLLDQFHAMIRRKIPVLDSWISDATTSLMTSFSSGVSKDKEAVAAAIESPWSNAKPKD